MAGSLELELGKSTVLPCHGCDQEGECLHLRFDGMLFAAQPLWWIGAIGTGTCSSQTCCRSKLSKFDRISLDCGLPATELSEAPLDCMAYTMSRHLCDRPGMVNAFQQSWLLKLCVAIPNSWKHRASPYSVASDMLESRQQSGRK